MASETLQKPKHLTLSEIREASDQASAIIAQWPAWKRELEFSTVRPPQQTERQRSQSSSSSVPSP
jgi:hypothetical protein